MTADSRGWRQSGRRVRRVNEGSAVLGERRLAPYV